MNQSKITRRVLVTIMALFALSASAQTSTGATSSTTTTEQAGVKPSPWSGSVLMLVQQDAKSRSEHFTDPYKHEDQFDPYASIVDSELHLKATYTLNNGDKIKVNQRVYYSVLSDSNLQKFGSALGTLRLEYTRPLKVGSGSAITARLGLPTTYESLWESNMLASWAVMPSLNFDVTPKVSLSYAGYLGGSLYSGNARKAPSVFYDSVARGNGAYSQSNIDSYLAATAQQREYVYIDNSFSASYNFSDKLSVSQSLGYAFGLKNFSDNFKNFQKRTGLFEIGTELGLQATKKLSLAMGIAQSVADSPGAADLNSGKPVYFDGYQFALYRAEQTTYYIQGNLAL